MCLSLIKPETKTSDHTWKMEKKLEWLLLVKIWLTWIFSLYRRYACLPSVPSWVYFFCLLINSAVRCVASLHIIAVCVAPASPVNCSTSVPRRHILVDLNLAFWARGNTAETLCVDQLLILTCEFFVLFKAPPTLCDNHHFFGWLTRS